MAIPAYTFSKQFMDELKRIEEYFDKKLLESGLSDTIHSTSIDVPSFYNSKYFVPLRERYINAGWKNVGEGMDRNEHWLHFTLK